MGTQRSASATTSSAKPPEPVETITLSPGFTFVTPSPVSLTKPATSPPGEKGSLGLNWYLSWIISTSGKLTPQAFTVTTTWPLPADGLGTSWTTISSGGP